MPSPPSTCQPCSKTIVDATTPNVLQNPSQRPILQHVHYVLAFAALELQARAVVGYSKALTRGQDRRLQADTLKAAGCDYIVSQVENVADHNLWPQLQHLISRQSGDEPRSVRRRDRLSRSVKKLIMIGKGPSERKGRLPFLNDQTDTATSQGARASGRIIGRRRLLATAQIAQAQASLATKRMTQVKTARALSGSGATLIQDTVPVKECNE